MGMRRWFLHNMRSALGTAQTLNRVTDLSGRISHLDAVAAASDQYIQLLSDQLARQDLAAAGFVEQLRHLNLRIDQLEKRLVAALAESVESPAAPPGTTKLLVNGDPIFLPDDLVKFVIHTRVSAADAPVPKLLAETEHYLWCKERLGPGDQALDVGANIGLFAVMMGRRVRYGQVGVVHAFEASPTVAGDLRRVIEANSLSGNVCVHHAAVADQPGTLSFIDLDTGNVNREASHLVGVGPDAAVADAPGQVTVPAVSLDAFVAAQGGPVLPRLIKIDVEGAEFLVLDGARKLIGDLHPCLCIEIHPDKNRVFDHARLRAYLDGFGYTYTHRDKTYYCE
jgi:FkbM family methyltransferase